MNADTNQWLESDAKHCWHPFTPQGAWCEGTLGERLVIVSGKGVWLTDSEGRRYIDGNSSIWTNIHGHSHPQLNAAIANQLEKVAHTSYLGFANPLASQLAKQLVDFFPNSDLQRVFFSDDGSTAMEAAIKMALQYRRQTGEEERTGFVSFAHGYHGDTMGAASLGDVETFFAPFGRFGIPVDTVSSLEALRGLGEEKIAQIAAVVIEPLIQGVNHMTPWPSGMLRELREWTSQRGIHLILDEVMTGFGRTGRMFACQQEEVIPDFLCVAKGITGGYLPLAATLVTQSIYEGFLGESSRAFYYGHSYTANQVACAVALASLEIFKSEKTLERLPEKITHLSQKLAELKEKKGVEATRQCGLVSGIDIAGDDWSLGQHVCIEARQHGLLTRPIGNTIVFMPPLSISCEEIDVAFDALDKAIATLF